MTGWLETGECSETSLSGELTCNVMWLRRVRELSLDCVIVAFASLLFIIMDCYLSDRSSKHVRIQPVKSLNSLQREGSAGRERHMTVD